MNEPRKITEELSTSLNVDALARREVMLKKRRTLEKAGFQQCNPVKIMKSSTLALREAQTIVGKISANGVSGHGKQWMFLKPADLADMGFNRYSREVTSSNYPDIVALRAKSVAEVALFLMGFTNHDIVLLVGTVTADGLSMSSHLIVKKVLDRRNETTDES